MDVSSKDFERAVIERSHDLPVVVDFWAAWCAPCRMLGPALEGEAAKRKGMLELVKLDVDVEHEVAARYGVQSIPTVVAFRDGEPLAGFIGARPPRAIGEFFDEQVIDRAPQPVLAEATGAATAAVESSL